MPGVGKSQLAISYALNSMMIYKNIIMLDATSEESLQHDFVLLADKLHLFQNKRTKNFNKKDMYDFLNSYKTLCIFDNANPSMIKHLPANTSEYENLFFIFTSTTIDWEMNGETKVKKPIINLDIFSESETKQFLVQRFGSIIYDIQNITSLGEELGNYPLALSLAAAYIIQSAKEGMENPILSYMELISTQDDNSGQFQLHLNLLEKVWKPTLQKLEENDSGKLALRILDVISYLEPHRIPVSLLIPKATLTTQNALKALKNYCIISISDEKHTKGIHIEIHKLLQNITRSKIEKNEKVKDILEKGMNLIKQQLLLSNNANSFFDLPRNCSLHSATLIKHSKQYPPVLKEFPDVTTCTIVRLNLDFNCKLSSDIAEIVQPIFDSSERLASFSLELKAIQTETQIRLGFYDNALEKLNTLIDEQDKEKPNLCYCAQLYFYKAMALEKLGKLEESIEHLRLVVSFFTRLLEKNDHRLIASKHNLACVLKDCEQYDEALQLFFENLDIIETSTSAEFGTINKISSRLEISKILQANGFLADSKSMIDEAIEELETQVTEESPIVLSEKHNRNLLLDELGVKPSEILADCLKIYETKCKVLGKHHPSTQQTGARVDTLCEKAGSEATGEMLFNDALASLEKSLGKKHNTVLNIKHNITMSKERSGQFFEAFYAYGEIYTDKCEVLGKEHTSTLGTRERMAYCLYMLKNAQPALEIYDEIIESYIKKFSKNNLDLQTTRHNRAMVLNLLGKNDEALAEFNNIVSIDELIYGIDHIMTLRTKERIANVLRETGNLVEAKKLFEETLPKLKDHYGSLHDDVICARVNRARVLEDMGKRTSAIIIYCRCRDILNAKHRMSHYLTEIVQDLCDSLQDKIFKEGAQESDSDDGDISDDFVYPSNELATYNESSSEDEESEGDNDNINMKVDNEAGA